MSSNNNLNKLDVLANHRNALMLAETAAWLHMFGKFHEDFLKGDHDLDTRIPHGVPTSLSNLLKNNDSNWAGNIWDELPIREFAAKNISIFEMIEKHKPPKKGYAGFLQLMADAHGRGSGIEKGVLERFAPGQYTEVYSSTALGHEDDKAINLLVVSSKRRDLYECLRKQLLDTLKKNNAKLSCDEWALFQQEFTQTIKQCFSKSVAETRLPFSDVTLLDQTAISVACFKAALAQNLLTGNWQDPEAQPYRWRMLRIGLDGPTFWGNALRISDLLARKELVNKALDEVRILLEVAYPLGAEIYRDENGSIFLVPDIEDLLRYVGSTEQGSQSLCTQIQEIAHNLFLKEAHFTIKPLSLSTRDMLIFGDLAKEKLPVPRPQPDQLQNEWEGKKGDVCPVCGLRPQGMNDKALERKVCDPCEKRRSNRSLQWIDSDRASTIWLDEVADRNGQLALLVGRFTMDDWLSSAAFNTVLCFDPISGLHSYKDKSGELKSVDFDLEELLNEIQCGKGLKSSKKCECTLLGPLIDVNKRGGRGATLEEFYKSRIKHTDLEVFDQDLSVSKADLLILSLLRQPPSFARIMRTWETAKTFWQEVVTEQPCLKESQIDGRLRICGIMPSGGKSPIVSHTYELKIDSINLSVTCASTNPEEFITVDNLQRTAILLDVSRDTYSDAMNAVYGRIMKYKTGTFELEEATGYGGPNKKLGTLKINKVLREKLSTPCLPVIKIVDEPRTFMALVPADKAWDIAQTIKRKYEKEMGKVRNRLPMTLGVVFAGQRTPLPAILQAGRRMLQQPTQTEPWEVISKDCSLGEIELTLQKREGIKAVTLSLKVPIVMNGSRREDPWYPYWCVEKDGNGNPPSGRPRQIKSIDPCWYSKKNQDDASMGASGQSANSGNNQSGGLKDWVHVSDLKKGDVVYFQPSRFDFEMLDTAARRFEISYENGKRRGTVHPGRPYYLEQMDDFAKLWNILYEQLATSQIHNLIELIETKRLEWDAQQDDEVFKTMVRDILRNTAWKQLPNKEELKDLENAAVSGQLADIFELYVRILKKKTKVDEAGEKK